ncbi:MAG: hypothetical protein RIG77_12175 [Cyclobacteriaceae bacterium]
MKPTIPEARVQGILSNKNGGECVNYQLLPPEFELKTSGFVVEFNNEVGS